MSELRSVEAGKDGCVAYLSFPSFANSLFASETWARRCDFTVRLLLESYKKRQNSFLNRRRGTSLWSKLVQAAQVSKELPKKGGTGYVEGYPGGSRLTGIPGPKRVLPWSMVQPGLAMEQACELGTK
ncbi:hypothetical protein V6N13_035053 [Hibiscus sabdariffa]|uniref:Uncharacterized protein n=2 Tax=Hibiscus sabdariffa TaxID=183260 RepID=A0ABR2AZR3_9ROSI